MIQAELIETHRLKQFVLRKASDNGFPVIFLHGNASHSKIWESFFKLFDKQFDLYAPDLRGFGQTQDLRIDATQGVQVWADDVLALADYYKLESFHLAGHSLGGMVCFGLLSKAPDRIKSISFLAPGSPYGYGGTKSKDGVPTFPDFSGSGAGLINTTLLEFVKNKQLRLSHPSSPINVIKRLYFSPDFKVSDSLLMELAESMTYIKIGDERYPGDFEVSSNWPYKSPGKWGPVNAISPKWNQSLVSSTLEIKVKPKLLWIHGTDDLLVSNRAMSDPGTQGKLGFLKNWPGAEIYPPQPMLDQLTYFLGQYTKTGGKVSKIELDRTGHCPHLEKPEEVLEALLDFWR